MKKHTVYIHLGIFICILMPLALLAQSSPVQGGEVDAPIDGGLSLLVMAGAGYGIKKLKERKGAAK
ncbi:PID-CTERM protein-sorting domain-containing protein [Parasediminibacterium paludis]|uniref:PID-CTERM protein-sorting domain-containing protein n=1 Tax=Parasediminibacterium paludis TaxID=908966 RepID=A0ABV8PQM4_9BACT